jgi:hypothetical protein
MIAATVSTTPIDRLRARLAKIARPNAVPVLETVQNIMDDDNRRGILAGEDGRGNPMLLPSYRPVIQGQVKPGGKGARLTVEQRLGQNARVKRGRYAAFGSSAEGLFNNLSSSAYRKLDGPPLAPRRQFSRVITNYMQRYGQVGTNRWEVVGAWINVVSRKGVPFLLAHFQGAGRLPIRDLRGIRPWGMEKIRAATRNWMIDQMRSSS